MDKSNRSNERPRDAEGRFVSKNQGGSSQNSRSKSSQDRPRDSDGKFESKSSSK